MSELIVVTSKGKSTRGELKESREVHVPTETELEGAIRAGMVDVAMIASGEGVTDPTIPFLKHCSRCLAMGRQPYHVVNFADPEKSEFTIKKDGKPHSQCKKCRSEQACDWQKKKARERAVYQKTYHASYPRKTKAERQAMVMRRAVQEEATNKMNGLDSMFIAVDKNKSAKGGK